MKPGRIFKIKTELENHLDEIKKDDFANGVDVESDQYKEKIDQIRKKLLKKLKIGEQEYQDIEKNIRMEEEEIETANVKEDIISVLQEMKADKSVIEFADDFFRLKVRMGKLEAKKPEWTEIQGKPGHVEQPFDQRDIKGLSINQINHIDNDHKKIVGDVFKLSNRYEEIFNTVKVNQETILSRQINHSNLLGIGPDDHHLEKHTLESHKESEWQEKFKRLIGGGNADDLHRHRFPVERPPYAFEPWGVTKGDTDSWYLRLDGTTLPTANISWNSKKITSLADPTADQDAATKAYVDAQITGENWWDRTGTVLSPHNAGDTISVAGATIGSLSGYVKATAGVLSAGSIADGDLPSALTGKTYNALTLVAAATGFTIAGGTTSKTLTVPLDASVSGTNTGDNAANSSTMYIGTTAVALNRASAALVLTGITSIDGNAATVTGLSVTSGKTLTVSESATIAINSITLGGGEVITFSATNALSLLTTGATSVTLPTTGTLVSSVTTGNGVSATNTAGALAFTLGVIAPTSVNGLTFVAAATGFTIAGGTTSKTLTVSDSVTLAINSITLAGGEVITFSASNALSLLTTAPTSITFPTTGTLLANLIEDTSPQLGGELDCQAHSIGFTQQTATGDGTTTIDWKLGNKFYFTFGNSNEVFTFTAPTKPCNLILVLKQYSTGGKTATWPGTIMWPAGTAPTLSTGNNDIDIVSFYFDGTNYFGNNSLDFSVPA